MGQDHVGADDRRSGSSCTHEYNSINGSYRGFPPRGLLDLGNAKSDELDRFPTLDLKHILQLFLIDYLVRGASKRVDDPLDPFSFRVHESLLVLH